MGKSKKIIKRRKLSIKKVIRFILVVVGIILILLVGYLVLNKYLFNNKDKELNITENVKIDLDDYDYYLRSNATKYEKGVAEELKEVLSKDEVVEKDYAEVLVKLFVSDLFTLGNKNSSSDITSSQYVYDSYQEMFEKQVKDTIYYSIELNLDGTRNQTLPMVTNIEVISINNGEFLYNKEVLDSNAYYVTVSIDYEEDLGYPVDYEVVLVRNNNLLQVVKASEV